MAWGAWPAPLLLPGGRWQGCVLQGSASLGLGSCRLPQWPGGPRAQMTWRLRVPALQLLEHWGPRGGRGKKGRAQKRSKTLGLGVPTRKRGRGKMPGRQARPREGHVSSRLSETQGTRPGWQGKGRGRGKHSPDPRRLHARPGHGLGDSLHAHRAP